MKKSLIYILFTAFLLTSCQFRSLDNEGQPCTVSISMSKSTKVASILSDGAIRNAQVLVFRPDGALDAYAKALDNPGSISVRTSTGPKVIYLVVNMDDLSSVATLSALESRTSNLIADNTVDGASVYPVMTGRRDITLSGDCDMNIPVQRLSSRVLTRKITNGITNESLLTGPVDIHSLYLTNLVSDINIADCSQAGETWYNKLTRESDHALFNEDLSLSLSQGEYDIEKHSLYLYPNGQELDSSSPVWAPRHSRFVIDATIGGERYFYPVTMPVVNRNTSFEFENIIIARVGSLSEEQPLSYASLILNAGTIGGFVPDETGLEYTNAGQQVMVFCPDGVDPFTYLEEYLEAESYGQILVLNDGTVSPFEIAYAYKDLAAATFLVYFKDGTVKPYDTLPQDLDMDAVEKIVILNPDNIEDFNATMDYLKDMLAVAVLVYFTDGTIGAYGDVPADLDLSTVVKVVAIDEALLEDFAFRELVGSLESCTVLVYFKDGSVAAYDELPQGLDMESVSQILVLNNITIGDFTGATEGMDLSTVVVVVYLKDGTVTAYDTVPGDLTLDSIDRIIVLDPTAISAFAELFEGLDMSTTTVLLYFDNGTIKVYDSADGALVLDSASRIVIVNTTEVNPFTEDIQDKIVISNGTAVIIVVGDTTAFSSTLEAISVNDKLGKRVIIFCDSELDGFTSDGYDFIVRANS